MKAAGRWTRLWGDIKSLALPLGSFWISTLLANACFTAAVFLTGNRTQEDIGVITGYWTGCILGLGVGQALALLRLRPTLVLGGGALFVAVLWTFLFSYFVGQAATGLSSDIVGLALVVCGFVAPFFFPCGYWSLSAHTGMLATFAPILGFTSAILIVSESKGNDAAWFAGDKWAIWSVFTLPMLALAVMLILVYLATREIHRLHRWKNSDRSTEMSAHRSAVAAKANPGCSGLFALLLLGTFLTASTALIAPYLWRTETRDEGESGSQNSQTTTGSEPTQPQQGQNPQGGQSPQEQLEEGVQQGAQSLLFLLLMLFLALLGLAVFGPPLRRTLLLAFLRRPFWPVAPTRRALQHWRLVEIALGDIGVPRQPQDSAITLVERAIQQVSFLDPEPLVQCATRIDRVQFGLGLLPDDVMMARRTAEMTYQTVWDELGEWAKIRAMYRIL